MRQITFREALNESLRYNMKNDDRVLCRGEDIGVLGGLQPVVEIMYIDFTPGYMDMIINQMSKVHYMFGGQSKVPIVLRIVTGAMGENAAQHSQSFYSFFYSHSGGLIVVTPITPYDAKGLMKPLSSLK